jgi:hypothetical protein
VAISGIYWALVTLIDISLWLIDTTRQFIARDAHAITLDAFAHAHAPLPELPAFPPAGVALALPSMATAPVFPCPVVQWVSVPEALNDMAPALTLCPSVVPMDLTQFLNPDHSVRSWLISALPLALAPFFAQPVPVSPVVPPVVPSVTEAAPVMKKLASPRSQRKRHKTKPLVSDRPKQQRRQLSSSSAGALVRLARALHFSGYDTDSGIFYDPSLCKTHIN